MKEIDLLIYDLDGTLIDSVQDIMNGVNHMLAELRLKNRTSDEIKSFIGEGIQSLIARSIGEQNIGRADQALKILRNYYGAHLLDHTKLYPGVFETLKHFRSKKQAVVTNKPEKFSLKVLEGLGISSFFESVIGGDTVRTKKPSPEGVFYVLNQFQVSSGRAVIVGDSSIDVETGRNAKIATCVVTYGLGDRRAIEVSKPDFTIPKFSDLIKLFN